MHLFRLFIDSSGWLVMQYKVSPIDFIQSPIDGLLIRLWKANLNVSPKLPNRIPSPILYHPIWGNDASRLMEREKFINFNLSKYMDFWKVGIAQNSTYEMKVKMCVEYWEDVLLHLSKSLPFQSTILFYAPLSSQMDSTLNLKVKTSEGEGVGCALWLATLWGQRGKLKLWDGTRKINKQFTYSQGPTQTKPQVGQYVVGALWCTDEPWANTDSQDSPWPGLGGSHHLPSYSILCDWPWDQHPNVILSQDSQVGVP